MTAARASADPRDRLVVELLARTGMRAGELAGLDAAWTAANLEHIRRHKRLVADHRGPLDRYVIGRVVARVGRAAGVPGVHPHRLRRTLATQAINRGMRLEAIAALPGHRKMEMTLIYVRIANRVVADEYAQVSAKIDALYGQPPQLPADYESAGMARLRREAHARRDAHLPRRLAIRQPGTGPRRQPDRLRRPPRLHHRHPLRRPAPVRLPPRSQRRRRPVRRADTMINKTRLMHHVLDKITHITPTRCLSSQPT